MEQEMRAEPISPPNGGPTPSELMLWTAVNSPVQRIGVAAITENLLKRKWSAVILRHLSQGSNDPSEIAKIETSISPKVMSERLRTMMRYGLIARFPRPAPSSVIEYRLTVLGTKILGMIDSINSLDQQLRQSWSVASAHSENMSDARPHE